MKTILITGGSGLLGKSLSQELLALGYKVAWLGRSKNLQRTDIEQYSWDIANRWLDPKALEKTDVIVHLAGENVADGSWTDRKKEKIRQSRILSTQLLAEKLQTLPNSVETFISASGIGYYGTDLSDDWVNENSEAGNDFLAQVCREWEQASEKISDLGKRLVKIRIGVVFSKKGGALEAFAKPIRLYAGAVLGTGSQYISWVHEKDLLKILIKAIEDPNLSGVYNAVAPHPIRHEELIKGISLVLKRPILLPAIPNFAIKLLLGEMAEIVLKGKRVSAEKIQNSGFSFQFENSMACLDDLLG